MKPGTLVRLGVDWVKDQRNNPVHVWNTLDENDYTTNGRVEPDDVGLTLADPDVCGRVLCLFADLRIGYVYAKKLTSV